jgi:hypothetical protein
VDDHVGALDHSLEQGAIAVPDELREAYSQVR